MSFKIRMISATSLYDGHDASINIMRRIMQDKGVEVIHLGHNRSASEIAIAAIEEDVQGIALTSYQGGHIEFFCYVRKLLDSAGYQHIKIIGGGGGTILPSEAAYLHQHGITKIYLPEDGLKLGLDNMINEVVEYCNFKIPKISNLKTQPWKLNKVLDPRALSNAITLLDNNEAKKISKPALKSKPIWGITGTGGAGKSSVIDELVRIFLLNNPSKTVAILSVDPSKQKTGGALLGDRIRLNIASHPNVFIRSIATRNSLSSLNQQLKNMVSATSAYGYDLIIVETAGVGQNDISILECCSQTMYVMTSEYGAATQLEKINMLDFADIVCLNKFDRAGGLDALHDIRKQYKRNHKLFKETDNNLPIFPTVASHFNDPAMLILYNNFIEKSNEKYHTQWHKNPIVNKTAEHYVAIIPTTHKNYLAEISQIIRTYRKDTTHQAQLATLLYQLEGTLQEVPSLKSHTEFIQKKEQVEGKITLENKQYIKQWPQLCLDYQKDFLEFEVRNQTKKLPLTYTSQSGTKLSKIQLPKYKDWGSILAWILKENLPGRFPYTSGVYELKRTTEDPTRMFAGEGCPERTNHRFHYVSEGQPAIRLSTAFDSVTLYGENPDLRDDIFGKIGNAGVSIATLDDIKKLYSGFDLNNPNTSVSMTINGPSPVILAFFLNAAIDQACETYITQHNLWTAVHKKINQIYGKQKMPLYNHPELHQKLPKTHSGLGLQLLGISGNEVLEPPIYNDIKQNVLKNLRGTVQADILKEDQAQNTCIFSTEFALKLMGDIQVYFSENKIRNFYSISISGYHIAEAGANPITQLAFTLANGFSFVEYFINRGLDVNVFAPNLSFFFSNGMDEEYAVIGRVARRIWAITMKQKYGADDRAQKLKYHIQTSGRSLHAQEIDFNDIRTTLQALYAIYDQCNSLHTNAYDEAITTPTTESVRRAIAIQLIINKELGTARMENFIQGSFVIEELTNLVEEAVLKEFDRINERGGVLGAMERMYQRSKIQDESLDYEHKKHTGEIPIIGVNTFIGEHKIDLNKVEVFRSTTKEKMQQIDNLNNFHKRHQSKATEYLKAVQAKAQTGGNVFSVLMEAVKYCSLGQISQALFEVGGKYRRNM